MPDMNTKLDSQLVHLLAQDVSKMGYQARIRHQKRIDDLRARRDAKPMEECVASNEERSLVTPDQPFSG